MKKRILSLAVALALCLGLTIPTYAVNRTFTDVPAGAWYSEWVEKAVAGGLISGYSDGRFGPNDNVTYAQLAVMLTRALYPADMSKQTGGGAWWTPYAETADRHGLWADTAMEQKAGWGATANMPIPREHMAQMLFNALTDTNKKLPSYEEYSEVSLSINDIIDTDNYDAVASCYALGLIAGDGNGNFDPHDYMTRAQAAVVMCRLLGDTTTPTPVPDQTLKPDETSADTGRPDGALGGHYDVNQYTVPADTNKDGWLTEAEVKAALEQLMEEYPEGSQWGEEKRYTSKIWGMTGIACVAYAMTVSDRIFGDLPKRVQFDAYSIRIGDVITNSQHWGVVYNLWWYDEDPSQGVLYGISGNVGGKVGLGGDSYGDIDRDIKNNHAVTVYTRYPRE